MSKKSLLIGCLLAAALWSGTLTLLAAEITPAQVAEYRVAAEQCDAVAQYKLSMCYADGRGVKKDYKQAVEWYRKAAEQGDAMAQEALKKLGK